MLHSRPAIIALALVFVCLFVGPAAERADADAIVRTQAMFATTIAEFFVDDDTVRAELEIGAADLPVFADLLPDDIYEKLGNPPRPWAERLGRFFAEGLVISDDVARAPQRGADVPRSDEDTTT